MASEALSSRSQVALPSTVTMKPRNKPRQRTLKAGRIIFNNKSSILTCTVRSLSDSGACVQLAASVGVPNSSDLTLEVDGHCRPCNVVWQYNNRVGVAFR